MLWETDDCQLADMINKLDRMDRQMNNQIIILANVLAVVGVVVCSIAGVERLLGNYFILGFQSMTLFSGGIAVMVFAVLINVYLIRNHLVGR